jgi:hypothetical protein
MSDDDIYQTDKYFGGKIILKGYKDPVTHQPTKEYVELREAFDRIAKFESGCRTNRANSDESDGSGTAHDMGNSADGSGCQCPEIARSGEAWLAGHHRSELVSRYSIWEP